MLDKVLEVLEELEWGFHVYEETLEIEGFSPAGENFSFCVSQKNAAEEIANYAENFDVDEHIAMWIMAKRSGTKKIPATRVLCRDAEAIRKMLKGLADAVTAAVKPEAHAPAGLQDSPMPDPMKIRLYVLYGAWGDLDTDGSDVICISDSSGLPMVKLNEIASSRAAEFLQVRGEYAEDRTERGYEISDDNGGFARFFISEKEVKLSSETRCAVYLEMEKQGQIADIKEAIGDLYESRVMPAWLLTYATASQNVLQAIHQRLEKNLSCNVPNETVLLSIKEVLRGISLTDDVLETLWDVFGNVPINDEDEILEEFIDFPEGTDRFEVWHWFDEHYTGGIEALRSKKGE